MRARRVHELGDPDDVLTLEEIERPTPRPGHVLVQVRAAALIFFNALEIQGRCQPGRRDLRRGRRDRPAGARKVAGGPGRLRRVRTDGSRDGVAGARGDADEKADALFTTYQTGHLGLRRRANRRPEEWPLVHAAAGGIGSAAIQPGKAAGPR